MRVQEPLSVFRRSEPAAASRLAVLPLLCRLTLSRALAAISAAFLLAYVAADVSGPKPHSAAGHARAQPSPWLETVRASGAFALASPQLGALEQSYLTRLHRTGEGRQDILTFGAATNPSAAFIRIVLYRPGSEGAVSVDPAEAVAAVVADARIDAELQEPSGSVVTKFGELATLDLQIRNGATDRHCLAAAARFDEPGLGLVVWYCNPGEEIVAASQISCMLDRLALASSGRDEKLIAFFAKAERNRSFCDARNALYGQAPRTPDWIDTGAGPVLRGKFSAR